MKGNSTMQMLIIGDQSDQNTLDNAGIGFMKAGFETTITTFDAGSKMIKSLVNHWDVIMVIPPKLAFFDHTFVENLYFGVKKDHEDPDKTGFLDLRDSSMLKCKVVVLSLNKEIIDFLGKPRQKIKLKDLGSSLAGTLGIWGDGVPRIIKVRVISNLSTLAPDRRVSSKTPIPEESFYIVGDQWIRRWMQQN